MSSLSLSKAPDTDRPQWAVRFLMSLGWSFPQACAIVAQGMWESGGNHQNNILTRALGDGGTAHGGWQWRGDRYLGLLAFAEARGQSSADLRAQLLYVDHELRTSERRAGSLLRKATNVDEASAAVISYLRPAGFSWETPRNGHAFYFRLRLAQSLYDELIASVDSRPV
jgi:hypothetical protein